uniref:Uncharacterized protein n=1 Tax=Anguilla anguilla TaxID=7936 RepID=A0A0E9WRM5_ANGAN
MERKTSILVTKVIIPMTCKTVHILNKKNKRKKTIYGIEKEVTYKAGKTSLKYKCLKFVVFPKSFQLANLKS